MADNNNKKEEKKRRSIPSLKDFTRSVDRSDARVFGVDNSIERDLETTSEKVIDAINSVNSKHSKIVGDGIIEFFTSMVYEENNKKLSPKGSGKKVNNKLVNLLSNSNLAGLNNLFQNEQQRISLYNEYECIMNFIPQVYQAIDTIADAIISPDDFSKDVLIKTYDNNSAEDTEEQRRIFKNLDFLEKNYKIEYKLKKLIFNSLYKGDEFVLISSYKTEFENMLSEFGEIINTDEAKLLNESNFILSEEEIKSFTDFIDLPANQKKEISDEVIKKSLIKALNDNIVFCKDSKALLEKEFGIINEFNKEDESEAIFNKFMKDHASDHNFNNDKTANVDVKKYNVNNPTTTKFEADGKPINIDIRGSYMKTLNSERIVKIQLDETCYGYFYIETSLPNENRNNKIHLGNLIDFKFNNLIDFDKVGDNFDEFLNNPKLKLVMDVFTRAISGKVDKKFIEDNREFKKIIYELLKRDYIINKRIRIVFLKPDEVFHFYPEMGDDGYGISKLARVLFTCKLYIATLITNLMMKLSRSADHRAFYVETGLSADMEATISSFMRTIKSKELTLNDLKTVDSIFRSIGQFHDYFIPQVNGSRPVEMDIIQGQDVEIENDFMDYLRKAIISGLGVPSSFLQYADEIDFSRSISMQNSKFLRSIIVMQKTYNETITAMFRRLYLNEFGGEDININAISISLPSPSSLNMTNLADQISNVSGIIEFVANTLIDENKNDNDYNHRVKKVVTKRYLPDIPWDEIEKEINVSAIDDIAEKVMEKKSGDKEDDMDGGF